jgi:hypothetical protein
MFTKEEKRAHTQKFWSQFDQFCDTIPDLAWHKKRWILHDTKISHIDLKFDAGRNSVMVVLELNHKSEHRRLLVYELLERYRTIIGEGFNGKLIWDYCYLNENKQDVCRIYLHKDGVDMNNTTHWPEIFRFFADHMLQLQDNFLEIQEVLKEELTLLNREL